MKLRILWLAAALPLLNPAQGLTAAAPSLEPGAAAPAYAAFQERVTILTARERAAHRGDTNWFVRPGVFASATGHTAWVYGRATGLRPSDPVEFTLIATNSGHDYEALATAFASAADLAGAMRFIGMPDGQPVNREQPRFWPKGERVRMTIERFAGDDFTGRVARADTIESLLFDTRTSRTPPAQGWVYTGPNRIQDPAAADRTACAADVAGPQAIGALYNESAAIFDVPRQALQGEVYGAISPNPDALLAPGACVRVRIEPEHTDGRRRVRNLALTVTAAAGGPESLRFKLQEGDRIDTMNVVTNGGRKAILAAFGRLTESGYDPFVSVAFDAAMSVSNAQVAAAFLDGIEGEHGIRVEPPAPGELFYRALIPPERFRRRADRPQQPRELHASLKDGLLNASLVTIEEHWAEGAAQADLTVTSAPAIDPAGLSKMLAASPQPPVLLIFADPSVTLQQLRPYLSAARPTHPTVHIYTGAPR